MGLILRSIERMLKMQFSMGRKFTQIWRKCLKGQYHELFPDQVYREGFWNFLFRSKIGWYMSRINIFCILLIVRGPMISNSAGTKKFAVYECTVLYLSLGLKGCHVISLPPRPFTLVKRIWYTNVGCFEPPSAHSPLLNAYGTQMWGVSKFVVLAKIIGRRDAGISHAKNRWGNALIL